MELTRDIYLVIGQKEPVLQGAKGEPVEIIRESGIVLAVKSLTTGNRFTVKVEDVGPDTPKQTTIKQVPVVKATPPPPVEKIVLPTPLQEPIPKPLKKAKPVIQQTSLF